MQHVRPGRVRTLRARISAALAIAIVNLVRMLRLDAICLGGGIGLNSSYLREHLPAAVKERGPEVNKARAHRRATKMIRELRSLGYRVVTPAPSVNA